MITKEGTIAYLKGLGDVLLKMEVSNAQGQAKSLEAGFEDAIKVIAEQANRRKKITFIPFSYSFRERTLASIYDIFHLGPCSWEFNYCHGFSLT